jgi:Tol biopolymer transport system component
VTGPEFFSDGLIWSRGSRSPTSANKRQLWAFPANAQSLTDRADGQPLLANDWGGASPCLTPDGQALLFTSNRRGKQDICKLTFDGAAPQQLTDGHGNCFNASVAPDGRWIAFSLQTESGTHIAVMRPDGSDVRDLAPPGEREKFNFMQSATWSRDGKRIACLINSRDGQGGVAIFDMEVETGTARAITILDLPGSTDRPR